MVQGGDRAGGPRHAKRKPYPVFRAEEKGILKPLPEAPFQRPLWKKCTVHPDHHIVFDSSCYSLPTRYIGKKVWVKGTYMSSFF